MQRHSFCDIEWGELAYINLKPVQDINSDDDDFFVSTKKKGCSVLAT